MMLRSCFVFMLGVAMLGCRGESPTRPSSDAGPATPILELSAEGVANAEVKTTRLEPRSFAPRLRTIATVSGDPKGIARLGARVQGRVAKIDIALGDRVKKGQALLELDAVETHQVALEYATAKARSRAADDALARQRQLVAERVGAEQDLRRAEADAAAALATLREAEEHLRFLGVAAADIGRGDGEHIARSILRSPIDGQVAVLNAALGQVLNGNEDVVTVADVDRVWIDLRVYERDLGKVARGQSVDVEALAFPGRRFTGTVTFVGELLDPATRTVPARASLASPGPLRPGMTATAFVALGSEPDALWLPVEAVTQRHGETIVFVPVGERRYSPRTVLIGEEQGGFVRVRGGIARGSDVVIHGALQLRGELDRAALGE